MWREAPASRRVVLWPDTFNNHFHPRTAIAAVHGLERAGCRAEVPRVPVCCGRPLYDYGFLDTARDGLLHVVGVLSEEIREGVPVVGVEPSCVAVFRDEARELLPDREDVKRLARQSFTLSEFLQAIHLEYPKLKRKAIVHGHCHHTSRWPRATVKRDLPARTRNESTSRTWRADNRDGYLNVRGGDVAGRARGCRRCWSGGCSVRARPTTGATALVRS